MKQLLMECFQYIKQLIMECLQYIKQSIAESNSRKQKIAMENKALTNAFFIRNSLFEALKSHSYPNLSQILTPNNIRFSRWNLATNGGIFFYYTLAKQQHYESIPRAILQSISNNMNTDIAGTVNELIAQYGHEIVAQEYPLLYGGLYILMLRDIGTDIELTVATNCL